MKTAHHVRYCVAVWISPLHSLWAKKEGKGGVGEWGGEGHFDVTIKTHRRSVERDERDGAEVK